MDNELRGAVLSRYPSIKMFADALKWDRKKASRIVNRIQTPTVNDMYKMANLLSVRDSDTFVRLFLPNLPTMWRE